MKKLGVILISLFLALGLAATGCKKKEEVKAPIEEAVPEEVVPEEAIPEEVVPMAPSPEESIPTPPEEAPKEVPGKAPEEDIYR